VSMRHREEHKEKSLLMVVLSTLIFTTPNQNYDLLNLPTY